jgi:hypothetical protein
MSTSQFSQAGWLGGPVGFSPRKLAGPFVAGVAPFERWLIKQMSLLPTKTHPEARPCLSPSGAVFVKKFPGCKARPRQQALELSQAFTDNSGPMAPHSHLTQRRDKRAGERAGK